MGDGVAAQAVSILRCRFRMTVGMTDNGKVTYAQARCVKRRFHLGRHDVPADEMLAAFR